MNARDIQTTDLANSVSKTEHNLLTDRTERAIAFLCSSSVSQNQENVEISDGFGMANNGMVYKNSSSCHIYTHFNFKAHQIDLT